MDKKSREEHTIKHNTRKSDCKDIYFFRHCIIKREKMMQFHIFYFILLQKSNYKRQINDFQEYLASLDYLEFLEFQIIWNKVMGLTL